MQELGRNQLFILMSPILKLLKSILNSSHSCEVSEDIHREALEKFSEFDREATKLAVSKEHQVLTKYALAALFDEFVLTTEGSHKNLWMAIPLQTALFGEHLAGEQFFKKLDVLRRDPVNNINVLEIYYVMLVLGYQGKYCRLGLEQLEALKQNLYLQIQKVREYSRSYKVQTSLIQDKKNKPSQKLLTFGLIVICVSALFLIHEIYLRNMETEINKASQVMLQGN